MKKETLIKYVKELGCLISNRHMLKNCFSVKFNIGDTNDYPDLENVWLTYNHEKKQIGFYPEYVISKSGDGAFVGSRGIAVNIKDMNKKRLVLMHNAALNNMKTAMKESLIDAIQNESEEPLV